MAGSPQRRHQDDITAEHPIQRKRPGPGRFRQLMAMLLLISILVALNQGNAQQVAALILVAAISLSWTVGQFARSWGIPTALAFLATGVLMGEPLADLVSALEVYWPDVDGLLNDRMRAMGAPLRASAMGIAMLWVGRQVNFRRAREEWPTIAGLTVGHLTAATALGGVLYWLALGPQSNQAAPARIIHDLGDLVGLAITMTSASVLLVASVLQELRSEGPVARTALRTALLVELVALAVLALAQPLLGVEVPLLRDPGSIERIGGTLLMGVLAGGLIMAGTRKSQGHGLYVAVAVVLCALVANRVSLSIPLMMLTAGLMLGQFAPGQEDDAIDRLLPISFAVLFTFAGAALPLALIIPVLPIALGLAVLRAVVLLPAATGIARLIAGPSKASRYGWTALVATSIPVAGLMNWGALFSDVEANEELTAILWGIAAVTGALGPIFLRAAITLVEETDEIPESLRNQVGVRHRRDGWVDAGTMSHPDLTTQLAELQDDLSVLVEDLRGGPARLWKDSAEDYLTALRQASRRFEHRLKTISTMEEAEERQEAYLHAAEDFIDRWRSHVLDHSARVGRTLWDPEELVDILDQIVQSSPRTIQVPRTKSPSRGLRLAQSLLYLVSGSGKNRTIPLRQLYRYHLSGKVIERLEGVPAVMVNAEFNLSATTRALMLRALDQSRAMVQAKDPDKARLLLREDMQSQFDSALKGLDAVVDATCGRFKSILTHATTDIATDMERIGTVTLPARSRAWRKVQADRKAALAHLDDGMPGAMKAAATRFSALSLEMELLSLQTSVEAELDRHGTRIARQVRGRAYLQLERVQQALPEALEDLQAICQSDMTGAERAEAVHERVNQLTRITQEASRGTETLRDELAGHDALQPLLDAMSRASNSLTERYEVPVGSALEGAWSLPSDLQTAEVPFRKLVVDHLETTVTRNLLDLTRRYASKVDQVRHVVDDLEQVLNFNADLAASEMSGFAEDRPTDNSQRLAIQILLQGLPRQKELVADAMEASKEWFGQVEQKLRDVVITELEHLRAMIADGEFQEIQPAPERTLTTARRKGSEVLPELARRADQARLQAMDLVGQDRLDDLRDALGLQPSPDFRQALGPSSFRRPAPTAHIPIVYKRLFSGRALEAGELLEGRRALAEELAATLSSRSRGTLQAAALLGADGVGRQTVIRDALRHLKARTVYEHAPEGPVTVEQVRGWFDRGTHGHVHVVRHLHYFFQLKPGGFEALKALVEGIAKDAQRNVWIVSTNPHVWRYACDFAPLARVLPYAIHLEPFGQKELEEALLARHEMSGFSLRFAELDIDADQRAKQRFQSHWFRQFHRATEGIARDAMALWLSAIVDVDVAKKEVVMGAVPQVPLVALRRLTPRSLLTLQAASRQGWIDEATYMRLFREPEVQATARLSSLAHWGLLEWRDERYKMPAHLIRALHRVIKERGWAE